MFLLPRYRTAQGQTPRPHLLPPPFSLRLIRPFSRVVPRTNNKSLALARSPIYRLQYINQLLLRPNRKVDLVVIARAKVNLHMLVSPEEHDGAGIVDFVHGVEVGDLLLG